MSIVKIALKYSEIIESAYANYCKMKPLDLIQREDNDPELEYWRVNMQYDISEFSRQLYYLENSKNLNDFIHRGYSDFDNVAAIVKVASEFGIVKLRDTSITTDYVKPPSVHRDYEAKGSFIPDSDYNQFPCDNKSVAARVEFLLGRYPHLDSIHFGLIGDDDFVSMQLAQLPQFNLRVIEKDTRIIDVITSATGNQQIEIEEVDILNAFSDNPTKTLQSFMTDPPYTIHGVLTFIYCGLSRMAPRVDSIPEFYVILNPTMMGRNINVVLQTLSDAGVYLKNVNNNFSQYELPVEFSERQRANAFLRSLGVDNPSALKYSSSSNIYTFTLGDNFDLKILRNHINPKKLYEHYE